MKISKVWLAALSLALAPQAFAAKPKAPNSGSQGKFKDLDLGISNFGALPTDQKLESPKEAKPATESSVTVSNATYEVVKVLLGRQFTRSANGSTPTGGALKSISRSGTPPSTERFQSVVRIKSSAKVNAPIDLVFLDPRGDTAMSASGDLNFNSSKQNEVDYLVEWDPTPTRSAGEFKLLIRVAGQVLGTWPVQVVDQKK